jgi:hypothetical protein
MKNDPSSYWFPFLFKEEIYSMHSRNMKFVRLAFTSLLMFTGIRQAEASIVETWFPASSFNSNTAAMDATLGITGYLEDTFETTTLIPGLSITLSGSVPSTTWNALPSTFNPITQGDGFETNTQWDGTDVVDNGTNNQLHNNPWASVITFNYAAGATSFGIGLSGFQSTNPAGAFPITNHELFINGMDIATIETLAGSNWTPGLGRNAYLRVDVTGGSAITSVGFENLSSTNGPDFLIFDHLAVQAPVTATPEPSTIWLLLAAGAGMGAVHRLRRR